MPSIRRYMKKIENWKVLRKSFLMWGDDVETIALLITITIKILRSCLLLPANELVGGKIIQICKFICFKIIINFDVRNIQTRNRKFVKCFMSYWVVVLGIGSAAPTVITHIHRFRLRGGKHFSPRLTFSIRVFLGDGKTFVNRKKNSKIMQIFAQKIK